MLLAADIGATKTILALFSPETGPCKPAFERELITLSFPDLETLIGSYLQETGTAVESASLGIAAPIHNNVATMINTPWVISEDRLTRALNLNRVHLLNDLEAIANAVVLLSGQDLFTLNPGAPVPNSPIAVLAPGTGLGEAFLIANGNRYRSLASEGGHADFAPSDALEIDLLQYLGKKFDHVSYERVCSGPGLYYIYEFLKHSGRAEEPDWLTHKLSAAEDPVPVIVSTGTDRTQGCTICEMCLDIFTAILGAEAGNLALKVLAKGGVYIAGGIPPRMLDVLSQGRFMQRFRNKGRESFIVEKIPVHVVLNNRAGLYGAAAYGLENLV